MNAIYEKLVKCYEQIQENVPFRPKVALVLGSGLGEFANSIEVEATIDYRDIEGFPKATVQGHKGRFVFGRIDSIPVVIMQGRVHYYEGYPMSDVVLPIRLMKLMGAEVLLLTNAAGGVNYNFRVGDLMLITDQISSFVPSALMGENLEDLGERFPDMTEIYNKGLCGHIRDQAKELGITLREGIYIQMSGPAYESPAEVNMCRVFGADAVGMSTACEAVAANHMGMKVCGISCISNPASGMGDSPLCHEEVQEAADQVVDSFRKLIHATVRSIGGSGA